LNAGGLVRVKREPPSEGGAGRRGRAAGAGRGTIGRMGLSGWNEEEDEGAESEGDIIVLINFTLNSRVT